MKISGAANVNASQEAIWAALADPEVLSLAIPGLDQIDFADDGSYRFTFTTTIAAVSGTYTGEAGVVERAEPGVRVLRVSAASVKGKVGADVTIRLAAAADDATELSYTADADVDGAIAGIGQRMLASIAKRIAADAIGGLDAAFARPAPAAATPAAAGPAAAAGAAAATANAGPAGDGPGGASADTASGQVAIERARRGIGLRGERVPAIGRPGKAVGTGLLAGAAAAVAGVVIGAILRKRRGRR